MRSRRRLVLTGSCMMKERNYKAMWESLKSHFEYIGDMDSLQSMLNEEMEADVVDAATSAIEELSH